MFSLCLIAHDDVRLRIGLWQGRERLSSVNVHACMCALVRLLVRRGECASDIRPIQACVSERGEKERVRAVRIVKGYASAIGLVLGWSEIYAVNWAGMGEAN